MASNVPLKIYSRRSTELFLQVVSFAPIIFFIAVIGWSLFVIIKFIIPDTKTSYCLLPVLIVLLWSYVSVCLTSPGTTVVKTEDALNKSLEESAKNCLDATNTTNNLEKSSEIALRLSAANKSIQEPPKTPTTQSKPLLNSDDTVVSHVFSKITIKFESQYCKNSPDATTSSFKSPAQSIEANENILPMIEISPSSKLSDLEASHHLNENKFNFSQQSTFTMASKTSGGSMFDPSNLPQITGKRSPELLSLSECLELEANEPVSVKGNGGRRFCRKCSRLKPDRTHHCRSCKKCVLKMDHHCPWIKNCVGYHNYKYFLLFLFYLIIYSFICCILASYSFQKTIVFSETKTQNTLGMMVIGLSVTIFVGVFFLHHMWLTSKNMTTIERMEKQRYRFLTGTLKSNSPFNMGCRKNFIQVFGNNFLLWFIPIYTSTGNGKEFPLFMKFSSVCGESSGQNNNNNNNSILALV